MVIWKYELKITDSQKIPIGDRRAKPISVAVQNGKLMLWVQIDEDAPDGNQRVINIDIVGTGNNFETAKNFVGTAIMPSGFVWHIFAAVVPDTSLEEIEWAWVDSSRALFYPYTNPLPSKTPGGGTAIGTDESGNEIFQYDAKAMADIIKRP